MVEPGVEGLLRELAPQVLGAVVRRYGHFDLAEDAAQEALLAAATQWPAHGIPENPRGWLITVTARRLTDLLRSEQARRQREQAYELVPPGPVAETDDTLLVLFMCCHPSLSPASQIALTLRAVGGLTTAEVARAFLVPEATMTRRITRAKQTIRSSGVPFSSHVGALDSVLHVLYLIFNEGYLTTAGPTLSRVDLSAEAIRLTRTVHGLVPDDSEVAGLLALMLLTEARRPARTDAGGALIPMSEQDRSLWNAAFIREGVALLSTALPRGPTGPYQLQAAIAAVHDEAASADATDWPQIMALYEVLLQTQDNPVVVLNYAVAVAMVRGPDAGLALLAPLDDRLPGDHRLYAVRAHLQEIAGDVAAAAASYEAAAQRSTNPAQQRYLRSRAARL
jgi:RNA polymerase sigma factor (sigma-70 family)